MSSPFDHIEDHLRGFIEKSIQLLPDNNRLHIQLLRLARSLQNHLQEVIETEGVIPAAITISFNPINLISWRAHPEILDYLRAAIQDLAGDQGIPVPVAPDIHLEAEPSLPLDSFAIRQGSPSSGAEKTITTSLPHKPPGDIDSDQPAFYVIDEDNRSIPLSSPAINIGRSAHNTLVIDDPRVSRLHAQIRLVDGVHHIFDLNSRGGTFVNGKKVGHAALKSGDTISLAGCFLRCLDEPPQVSNHPSRTIQSPPP